jgi:hypothetical protein
MERLSLSDFKMESNNSQELENLTGGILGACHCDSCNSQLAGEDMFNYKDGASGYVLAVYLSHWLGIGDHGNNQ